MRLKAGEKFNALNRFPTAIVGFSFSSFRLSSENDIASCTRINNPISISHGRNQTMKTGNISRAISCIFYDIWVALFFPPNVGDGKFAMRKTFSVCTQNIHGNVHKALTWTPSQHTQGKKKYEMRIFMSLKRLRSQRCLLKCRKVHVDIMKMKFCRSIGKALKKEIHLTSAILLAGNGTRNGNFNM